jgi:DHA1 family bicyclomycin/chloramphenicol resistance-like MFS transporter
VGHIAGIAAAVTGFISTIMAVPISFLLAVLLQIGVAIICGLFDMCSIISRITYLFKNRRETGQYNFENRI